MKISFYQSECGDAARITLYDSSGQLRNIFIDSGFPRTFDNILFQEIADLESDNIPIDLWLISHIHDDHIGGALSYVKAVNYKRIRDIVKSWLYNAPRLIKPTNPSRTIISTPKSISQGDELARYLLTEKKLPVDTTTKSSKLMIGDLEMYFLSPTMKALEELRGKYSTKMLPLEKDELSVTSAAKAAKGNDYHIKVKDFDLKDNEEDQSIENGSSIAVLTKHNNKQVLWLADAHPSIICQSLSLLGYSSSEKLQCDIVKVAHHGSKGNNSNDLYDMIRCNNYVISSNGENKHYLPNKECLARILRSSERSKDSHYTFHFTYDNKTLRSIFSVDGEEVFKDFNFSVNYSNKKILDFEM